MRSKRRKRGRLAASRTSRRTNRTTSTKRLSKQRKSARHSQRLHRAKPLTRTGLKIRRRRGSIALKPETLRLPLWTPDLSLEPGIQLIGFNKAESGLGEACRLTASALACTDTPFHILSCDSWSLARPTDLTWVSAETNTSLHRANLLHFNPDMIDHICGSLGPTFFENRYNIGYWHWELPTLPQSWLSHFQAFHEIWTPSPFVRDVVAAQSPIPVLVMPPGITEGTGFRPGRDYFGLPHQAFLFLTMFDALSFIERKNPLASLQAFAQAFGQSSQHAALVIKVSNSYANSEAIEHLKAQAAHISNIYFIEIGLSRAETDALLNTCDSFVSLHRGEGFGLSMAEAMVIGKPVIGTNWSGNTSYMTIDNSLPVQYKLIPVGKSVGPYEAHQYWADPDIEHAAHQMRTIYSNGPLREQIQAAAKTTMLTHFSLPASGMRIQRRLQQLNLL